MRIFASDRVKNFMKALGMQAGEAIEHHMVSNAIEGSAARLKGATSTCVSNSRSSMAVSAEQRKVIYHMRNTLRR
jgi:preprotein translocase subunit SecA